MAVAIAIAGCGPSANVGRDGGLLPQDGNPAEAPPVPTLEGHPSPVPFTVATIHGEAPGADRVVVEGGKNPVAKTVRVDKTFCVDVPMPVPDTYTFEIRSLLLSEGLLSESAAMVTVEFDPSADEPSGWTTCSGAPPGECRSEPEICDDGIDNDCDGQVDIEDPDCNEGCDNDSFEPNDDIHAPLVATGRHPDLMICPDDEDFFRVQAAEGETIVARVFFSHLEGNLDMMLYRPDMTTVVGLGNSTTDDERISYDVPMGGGGEHIIRVYGVDGASAPYALDIGVTPTES